MKKFFSSKWFHIWWRWSLLFAVIIAVILWWTRPVPIVFFGISISRWFDIFSAPVFGLLFATTWYFEKSDATEELQMFWWVILLIELIFLLPAVKDLGLVGLILAFLGVSLPIFLIWIIWKILPKMIWKAIKNFFCPE